MRALIASLLRNHWQVLLIVPLVVIVMTWPTFAHIFDADEIRLHSTNMVDTGQKIWDAWHVRRFLAGESSYFYTDAMFHPRGISLAFHAGSTPHSILLLTLQQMLPTDDAYNLTYLLILCFNAASTYLLIHHLLKDQWIALFGAVVVGVNIWFTDNVTAPDLLLMGTLPLVVYFLHRSVMESRWRFAALAGICAGITAFIGLYIFLFLAMTIGIYAGYLAVSRWRQPAYWLRLMLFMGVCASIAIIRISPMYADAAISQEGFQFHYGVPVTRDFLESLVLTRNPFTGEFLHKVYNLAPDASYGNGYLGYINLFFIACALLHKPSRRLLVPWLGALVLFVILRLGDYLTFKGTDYTSFLLPEHYLGELIPPIFGTVGTPKHYQIGVVVPLAVLACFGLSALLRSKRVRVRAAVVLLFIVILALESYVPSQEFVIDREKTSYIDWLRKQSENDFKLINLPRGRIPSAYYLYFQTLSDYPTAYGFANRNIRSSERYLYRNSLLHAWYIQEAATCLPIANTHAYLTALDALLQDGFTHIVYHQWLDDDARLEPSFVNVPAAYDNGFVSVYRLADMRLNCQPPPMPTPLGHFLQSRWRLPEFGSSVISYHPNQSIDRDTFAYLGWFLSDWDNLIHLYTQDGEWMIQSASVELAYGNRSTKYGEVIYFIYDASHRVPRLPESVEFRDDFHLCQREAQADNAIIEFYLSQRFSCALIDSSNSLRVVYENGIVLENLLINIDQDYLDVQLMWSNLPSEPHSMSLQIFDAADDKVLGQDSTIGHISLRHQRVDISSLPPGNYVVKLIVYNFNTGHSVSGKVSETSVTFDRELEIAKIDRS